MFLLFISYFYSYYTFSLRETNDFVLTSLKAATQIPPIALEVFTQNMFYFKMSYESSQKIFQCGIYCPFRYILKFSE